MKRCSSSRTVIAGLAVALTVLSCDEGRLVTDVERQPLEATIAAPAGPDTLHVGAQAAFTSGLTVNGQAVVTEVIRWSANPQGVLVLDTTTLTARQTIGARAPGLVTLTVRTDHPDVQQASESTQVRVLLLGVAPVAPASGDTTLTALGDASTVVARGVGDGVAADSAGLLWTHQGSALAVTPPLRGRDSVRVEAIAAGTDTLIFRQEDGFCEQGQCVDTIYVHVAPTAARLEATDTAELGRFGASTTLTAEAFDANDNAIPGAPVTWSLVNAGDSVRIGLGAGGTVTARANGTVAVQAASGAARDTSVVVVHQVVAGVELPAGPDTLRALGATATLEAAVTDGGGAAVERTLATTWTSRTPAVVTVADLGSGQGQVTAVAPGSAWIVAEVESVRDSIRVVVAQRPAALTLSPAEDTLDALGATVALDAAVTDANGNDVEGGAVAWASLEPAVATVDGEGVVTAVAPGTARITATAGAVADSAVVVVRQQAASLTVADTVRLEAFGASSTLAATVRDANGNVIPSPGVTWTVAGETVAGTVTLSGSQVTAAANGTAFVEAAVETLRDTTAVVVRQAVETVALDRSALTFDALEVRDTLVVTVLDPGGAALARSFTTTWASNGTGVATVTGLTSGRGEVVSRGDGSASITATVEGVSDAAAITVAQVVDSVAIAPARDTLDALGDAVTLTATALDANARAVAGTAVTWQSLAPAVATVDAGTGEVTAVATGTAAITATAAGVTDTAVVVVRQVPASLTVTDTLTLGSIGATATLTATATDANGNVIPSPGVSWSIVEETVAGAVTRSGTEVTAAANGTTALEAVAGTLRDTTVVVSRQEVASVALDRSAVGFDALAARDTLSLTVLDPGGTAVSRSFATTWSSTASGVASVVGLAGPAGEVVAEGNGTASVTATVEGVADTAEVTVAQVVDSVAIAPAADTLNALGDTLTLTATALDPNDQPVAGEAVTWASLDPAVADTVDATSGRVVAVATGTARITATAAGVTDTVPVLVRQVAAAVVLSPDPVPDTLLAGDTVSLSAAVTDSNGVALPDAPAWSSTAPAVASVDGAGKVTAQTVSALDSTRVIATLDGAADSVWVYVEPATLTSVAVTPDSVALGAVGATATLSGAARNQNGNPIPGETLSWTSRDSGVATVDGAGEVTAVADGVVWVVATADADAGLQDSAKVVVDQVVASVDVTPASHTFTAHSDVQLFRARAYDANGVYVPDAVFTWSDNGQGYIGFLAAGTSDTTAEATSQANGTTWFVATEAGGMADSADVTVTQVPTAIAVTPAADTVNAADTVHLTATVTDANDAEITGASVTWTSQDTDVATVGPTGVVTGVNAGVASVIARPTGTAITPDTAVITVLTHVLEFDGDDYASVGGDVLDLDATSQPAGWTIELWVRPSSTTGAQYLVNKGNVLPSSKDAAYGIYLDAGVPTVYARSGNGPTAFDVLAAGSALSTGSWHHVAATLDNTTFTATLYVDGDSVAAATFAGHAHDVAGDLVFGAATTAAGSPFTGSLDEVRFWSGVRSPAEIGGAYAARLSGAETGLLAYWAIEGGSGNPVDAVGGLVMTLAAPTNDPAWAEEDPTLP